MAMLAAMAGPLSILVRDAALVLGLGVAGCRLAPAEAPPPDATAPWPGDDAERLAGDEGEIRAAAIAEPTPSRARTPRTIFRDEVERATGPGPAYLLRQLGPEPFRHDGRFVGWQITRLFPDDPELVASGCDLALGDVILGVNGHRLESPQDLSDALGALPRWTTLRVQSLRDGQRRDVTYTVIEDAT